MNTTINFISKDAQTTLSSTIAQRNTATCKLCGYSIVKGSNKLISVQPKQKKGVSIHCDCFNALVDNLDYINTVDNTANCKNHTFAVVVNKYDIVYFIMHGFKVSKRVNAHSVLLECDIINHYSIGHTINHIVDCGYTFYVDGMKMHTIKEYDATYRYIKSEHK